MKQEKKKKIIFVIAKKNFRDEEYFVPKEILEKAGFSIKTASNKPGIAIGADGGEVEIDLLVSEIKPDDFDVIAFVGGPGCLKNLDNEDSYILARMANVPEKILAAICISPVILAKSGVLKNKRATVWSSPMDKTGIDDLKENGAIYTAESVTVDGEIITGCGPSAAAEFGQAIIESLTR